MTAFGGEFNRSIYQPIMQRMVGSDSQFAGYESAFDSFLAEHTIGPYLSGKGVLFRQWLDRVEVIRDMTRDIEFDEILGRECRTSYVLTAQIYELQSYIQTLFEPTAEEPDDIARYRKAMKLFQGLNRRIRNYLRSRRQTDPRENEG